MNRTSFYTSMGLGVLLAMTSFYPTTADAVRTRGGAQSSVNSGGAQRASGNRNSGNAQNANRNTSANRNGNNNVNRNTSNNVNRNTNVNSNRNVNVNVDSDGGWNNNYNNYHPIATAAAVTATVAVIGSIVNQPPSTGCVQTVQNGTSYMQCGSTWYQPQYSGSQVNYMVVNPPY